MKICNCCGCDISDQSASPTWDCCEECITHIDAKISHDEYEEVRNKV